MFDPWVRHVLCGRMNGKTTKLDTATRTALDNGHHVHVADQDGVHCLADRCDTCGCAEHSCAADCDCCAEHEKDDQ